MRIGIASHIVLDTIIKYENAVESLGGPACYCGITARRFGLEVELVTKVGRDFPVDAQNILRDNNITLRDSSITDSLTTRFTLVTDHESRHLSLNAQCDRLSDKDIANAQVDCWIVSPVFDEVSFQVLDAIKKNPGKKKFIMFDPQGYMRDLGLEKEITLKESLDLDLTGIHGIKADGQELAALTNGLHGVEGMKALRDRGIEFVITTEHRAIHMLYKDMHYWIKLRDIDTPDATGAGDILASAFACAWIKEKDALWALCFGAGALRAALETGEIGLAKIPTMSKIESSASYFYNTVGFQDV